MKEKNKLTKFIIAFVIIILSVGCDLTKTEDSEPETSQKTEKSYSVSFSVGSQTDQSANKATGSDELSKNTLENIPDKYQYIKTIILTIKDSQGVLIKNRIKLNKINWAPGYILTEPLELPADSYTLEEFVLLDSNNNVLYATPRKNNFFTGEETVLAKFVDTPLPLAFDVIDQDNLVCTKVIDVNAEEDFKQNPAKFFGYDLGILDEVRVFMMDLTLVPVEDNEINGSVTITYGENESITEALTGNSIRVCLPKIDEDYNISITNSDGSLYNNSISYETIRDSAYAFTAELYYLFNAYFDVRDENNTNISVVATFRDNYWYLPVTNSRYRNDAIEMPEQPIEICLKENRLWNFWINHDGFQQFKQTYSVVDLMNSVTSPIVINLQPNTLSFPILMESTEGLDFTQVDIELISNGLTKTFTDLSLDTTQTLDMTRVENPIIINIIANGAIFQSMSESMKFNGNTNSLRIVSLYPSTVPIIDNFENTYDFWTPNDRFEKISYNHTSYWMSVDQYYTNSYATLTSREIDFDQNLHMVLSFDTNIYDEFSNLYIQQKNGDNWENVALVYLKQRDGNLFNQEINLNQLTGKKQLRFYLDMSGNFYNNGSGIDNIQLISKEYSEVQFEVELQSAGQNTSGSMIIQGLSPISKNLTAERNVVNFMPQGNKIRIQFTNTYGSVINDYDLETLQNQTTPLVVTMPDITKIEIPLLDESFETNLGQWVQASDDETNWVRNSGSTPSSSTGPSGAFDGSYYIYVEASDPNYPNKSASIISPYFDFDNYTDEFINMKVNMYGAYMGSLSVYYQNQGSTTWNMISSLSGNKGTAWFDFNNSLNSITGRARIRITGTTGSDFSSDMAIDKLVIGYKQ